MFLREAGLEGARLLEMPGRHPYVYADWLHAPGAPTLLVYGHHDVQPPGRPERWMAPAFEPSRRDGRLYGRGTVDDKGTFVTHVAAARAWLETVGRLPLNLKLLIEGEEEIGSEHLESFVREKKEMLKADLVLISDSSMFAKGIPSICYGLRGLAYMQVDLVGPKGDLHSGSFGGTVHNPIQALTEIVAQLHDKDGRVNIPGFYTKVRPLSAKERKAFKKLPWSARSLFRQAQHKPRRTYLILKV